MYGKISIKKQSLIMLLLFFILIISVEIIARTYEFVHPYCNLIDKDAFDKTDLYTLRWICIDANLVEWERSGIQHYVPNQYFHTININSQGFRGPEFSPQKPDDVYRIFVVGGSTTFGYGSTSDKTTIPGYIQENFNKVNLDKQIEIINGGIGAATSFEEEYLIRTKLTQYEPDLIVIYDGSNDVRYRNHEITLYDEKVNEKDPFKFKSYKFYRTPFVIWENILRHYETNPSTESSIHTSKSYSYVIDNWYDNMRKICELGEEKNFSTIIFIQPLLGAGNKTLSPDEKQFFLSDLAGFNMENNMLYQLYLKSKSLEDKCVSTHDLTNIFNGISEPLFYDQSHLNEYGNKIIADKIFDLIYPKVTNDLS